MVMDKKYLCSQCAREEKVTAFIQIKEQSSKSFHVGCFLFYV